MYNLDTDLAASVASNGLLLGVETGTTPRTPEILNSLMAMTNPLDNYTFAADAPKQSKHYHHHTNNNNVHSQMFTSASSDSNSSSCSQLESPTNGPNSVQQTCSQLIKAGLKLTIEQKRKHQSDNDDTLLDLDKCKRIKRNECSESEEDKHHNTGLTPEDEERRRRRRERNKIAATKCRLKKRERTTNLISESEVLEKQNVDLKNQIQQLQNEQMNLTALLKAHRAKCQNNIPEVTRDMIYAIPSSSGVNDHNTNNHSFNNRPTAVTTASSAVNGGYLAVYNRPNSGEVTFTRPIVPFVKQQPPAIVVESPTTTENSFQSHLTNLDNHHQTTHDLVYQHNYNSVQCLGYNNTSQSYDNGCLA